MKSVRVFRLIESSLVVLFFIQAARIAFAVLISLLSFSIDSKRLEMPLLYANIALVAALALGWFTPRVRRALPSTLSIISILVALGRVVVSLPQPLIRYYAAIALLGLGSVYLITLLRANYRTWLSAIVVGFALDMLLRIHDTYDISARIWFDVPVANSELRIPWFVVQVILSILVILISRLARGGARHELYEPASLSTWGGLAFGSFFTLEMLVLGMPNVVARWVGIPFQGLVPWLMLAMVAALLPPVRASISRLLAPFDDWLRGWVWLFAFLLMIVVGNRFSGLVAAAALIIAQFMAVLSLWWIPGPADPVEVENVGQSISFGLLVYVVLIYAYSLTFEYARVLPALRDQGIVVMIAAAALLGAIRIWQREDDPWLASTPVPKGIPMLFISPMVIFSLILSSAPVLSGDEDVPQNTVRIATYNINGGYDVNGVFQLGLIARTIEAGLADIVVLQEVDTGSPAGFGADQVEFIARRLEMNHVFWPTAEQVKGIAILSRWPITESSGEYLIGSGERLGVIRALIQTPGLPLTVVGGRLAPGEESQRLEQLGVLLSVSGDASPVVIVGDLAASPDDVVYQQLVLQGFSDPDQVLGIERGFTFPSDNPASRHDYVLVKGLIPIDARQVDSVASDHRLVVIEAGWPQ
nr:endonuclease/exonuclease/phosphatase family protein [Anaerolineae bacterium]